MVKNISSDVLSGYGKGPLTIATIGSHSALEVCRGAKDADLKNLVVCQKGRESIYSDYYFSRRQKSTNLPIGCVDEVLVVDRFSDVVESKVQKQLINKNSIFIPNRSFSVYVPFDDIENNFKVPIFGNRLLLRAEERDAQKNQYYLMKKAGIRTPYRFKTYESIDRLAIVKVSEADRKYERAFFFASSPADFNRKADEMIGKKIIDEASLDRAVIEEFAIGAQFNFNFFYSALNGELELMGIDTRRQTNLDGLLRLPANEQLEVLKHVRVNNIEVGHIASTLRESLLEKAFTNAQKLVDICKKEYSPGLIGPFALQGALISDESKEDFVTFDLSFRIPGSPGIAATPYAGYLYGHKMSIGKRMALEINEAKRQNRLSEILT
jgi:5-formaminoimidazole-4-carboxamide-1-(beta)-D-ribofuranosyl 5'-monophosphate synthetase